MAGYKPYPEYKDSGVEWLGEVPKHWNAWKVTHGFNRIGSGTTPKSENALHYDGGVPWVTTSELRETVIFETTKTITPEAVLHHSALKLFPAGSIAMAMYGATIGRLGKFGVEATVNQACCVFAEPTVFDSDFFYYWLWMRRPILISLSNGGGQPNLSQYDLKKLWIPIPGIEEQQTIARFLDQKTAQIDALIAKKQTLLEKLAEKRTALISHVVTKGLNLNTKMKDSGVEWLGEVPEHWKVKKLKFFVTAYGGGTPSTGKPEYWGGDIPWVSPKDMKSELINETEDYLSELGVSESATRLVPIDAVLIVVRSGILRHTIPVARNTVIVSLNQDMKALIPNDELKASFLHRLIQGNQKGLLPLWSKPGCTVESIEYSFMANTEIAVPPSAEQLAIVKYLNGAISKLDQQFDKARQTIEKLKEYRAALITQAVTGKIDVRNIKFYKATVKGEAA